MNESRREFVKSTIGMAGAAAIGFTAWRTAQGSEATPSHGVRHAGIALPPRSDVYEATLRRMDDDQCWLFFSENKTLVAKSSTDNGRTWGETFTPKDANGKPIDLGHGYAHLSLLHLQSGRLAIVHGGPNTRPGRDGVVLFRTSDDGGKTWSEEIAIDPLFAVCRNQAARVLSSGRIVVPVMKWISPYTGANSEDENNNLAYSWVYYSDDEGKTWHRSLSELLVILDNGRQGYSHFEETVLEELSDGRLLMIGRTEMGRPYRSFSDDQGISWTSPEPMELANAYTPSTLVRIPSTSDLLLIWNQASTEEILTGLGRQRLSTAISKDEGETWTHFRNLESLDDRVRIEPPPIEPQVYRMENFAYLQPADFERYPHAPGCTRICYPTVAFGDDEVAIAYDFGRGVGEFKGLSATKVTIVSLNWLYEQD